MLTLIPCFWPQSSSSPLWFLGLKYVTEPLSMYSPHLLETLVILWTPWFAPLLAFCWTNKLCIYLFLMCPVYSHPSVSVDNWFQDLSPSPTPPGYAKFQLLKSLIQNGMAFAYNIHTLCTLNTQYNVDSSQCNVPLIYCGDAGANKPTALLVV